MLKIFERLFCRHKYKRISWRYFSNKNDIKIGIIRVFQCDKCGKEKLEACRTHNGY